MSKVTIQYHSQMGDAKVYEGEYYTLEQRQAHVNHVMAKGGRINQVFG